MSEEQSGDRLVIGGPEAPRSRRARWIGGGVVALLAVGGAGAWAAASFFATGPQPAEALPADTIGYLSVDLDPGGGQKINALKVARKFPAFKEKVGLDTDDDLRAWIVEQAADDAGCDIDYATDVEPWLGSRMAVAAVGTEQPFPAVVVQVTDADKADAGLAKLAACDQSDGDDLAWTLTDDWAVLAETQAQADRVVADTRKGSLADDPDFTNWTDKAGDSGILTAYAAPAAGPVIADELAGHVSSDSGSDASAGDDSAIGSDGGTVSDTGAGEAGGSDAGVIDPFGLLGSCPGLTDGSAASESMRGRLADFSGAAATLRFSGDGLELEMVGDARAFGAASGAPTSAPVVTTLPADTAVALGVAIPEGWADKLADGISVCGQDVDPDDLFSSLSGLTGLDLPGDLERFFGDSAALALGPDIDVEGLVNSGDPSGLPVALKVRGDRAAVEKVVGRLPEGTATAVAGDDAVAVGLDQTYATQVAAEGGLGSSDVFTSVVPEADRASGVLYVNADALDAAIRKLAAGDDEVTDNLAPLRALGMSSRLDGKDVHALLKVSLD